jgi:hypothetical protein
MSWLSRVGERLPLKHLYVPHTIRGVLPQICFALLTYFCPPPPLHLVEHTLRYLVRYSSISPDPRVLPVESTSYRFQNNSTRHIETTAPLYPPENGTSRRVSRRSLRGRLASTHTSTVRHHRLDLLSSSHQRPPNSRNNRYFHCNRQDPVNLGVSLACLVVPRRHSLCRPLTAHPDAWIGRCTRAFE